MLAVSKDVTLVSVEKAWILAREGMQVYRVIVADDEPEFRRWLRTMLEGSEDFQLVGEASTGTEAVRLIPSLAPDLVIADMYMPEPDGLEVTRYVQHNFPDTKAILVSAHEGHVYERLAREEGALAFIPKVKLSLEALRQALRGEA
jgi:two-component system response regulator YesN